MAETSTDIGKGGHEQGSDQVARIIFGGWTSRDDEQFHAYADAQKQPEPAHSHTPELEHDLFPIDEWTPKFKMKYVGMVAVIAGEWIPIENDNSATAPPQ